MMEHEGWLYKVGARVKTFRRRWYWLQHNLLWWYSAREEGQPRGALFLEGSYAKPLADAAAERSGYHGFVIHTSSAHGDRTRVLYAASREARDEWLAVLRAACRCVPFEEDYALGRELGAGRFSRVYAATRRATGEQFAVKLIQKDALSAGERELLRTEIAILKLVQHPHIVRLEDVYESGGQLFIVMELMEGGELFDRIVGRARFTEAEARALVKPLVESVAYLHSRGIVHRDLKPENILCGARLQDVRIADFGLSKLVHPGEILTAAVGTLSYVAPEVLALRGYGREADLWSIGIILWLVVRGRLPFEGDDKEAVIRATLEARLDFTHPVWAAWTPDGVDFVRRILQRDPAARLTARQALQHPWLCVNDGQGIMPVAPSAQSPVQQPAPADVATPSLLEASGGAGHVQGEPDGGLGMTGSASPDTDGGGMPAALV
jgi:calcium/calmodulin-dependent protein kinase I